MFHIDFTRRQDIPIIAEIESRSNVDPWSEDRIVRELRTNTNIALSAHTEDATVGAVIYQMFKSYILIHKIVVDPEYRRMGCGTMLIDRLRKHHLEGGYRNRIVVDVVETNLSAQLFFRAVGFQWGRTIRNEVDTYRLRLARAKEGVRG